MRNLLRLISWLKPYRGRVLVSVGLSFGVAALTTISLSTLIPILRTLFAEDGTASLRAGVREHVGGWFPDFAEWVVATFLTGKLETLAWLLAAVVVLTALKGLLRFLNDYLVGTIALAASRDLSDRLFGDLLSQPVHFFEREGVGTVASRFTADADEVVRALKTLTGTIFREPFQFLCLLAFAIWLSPELTAAAVILFPLVGLLIRATGRKAKRKARRVLAHRSRLLSIVQETFFGIRVVQTFRAEGGERSRFEGENRRLYEENRRLVRVDAIASPAMELLAVIGVAGALMLGGAMAVRGELTVDQLVAFYAAIGALYEPVRKLGSAVPRIQAGLAGAVRIFAYLDRPPEVRDAPDATDLPSLEREIRFENVTYTYGGRAEALRDVDLAIRAGEQVALVGPSGSGKSTLAGLLPRFFDPESGVVRFDGRDIRTATLASLRAQIALVPQETILMNDTLRANIAFANPEAADEEVRDAARISHVLDFADELPEGFDTVVGERGAALSGGQRQRIAIARAILARPKVLILDEATSSVDDESARYIRSALEETREGRTTIVVTHRLDTISAADRVAVLSRGRLEAEGSPDEVLATSPTWRALTRGERS